MRITITINEAKGILLAPLFMIAFIFFIPISPTIKSILLVFSLALLLLTPYYRKLMAYSFNTLWGRAALLFLLYVLIACLWSPAPFAMEWSVIEKYSKLIYLPILAVGFINPKTRFWAMNSFIAAMVYTAIISILKAKGILTPDPDGATFYNHIITGIMMAFACYLSALFVFQYKGLVRAVYLLLVLFTSYQILFVNTGRTGYFVYFILVFLLFFQKLSFKKAIIAMMLFIGSLALVYNLSHTMQNGIKGLINEVRLFRHHEQNTSFGYRIQFHHYAKSLFKEHPILGQGTGGFKYRISKDNPVPSWGSKLTEPHSQYWMLLSELGITGLLLFFSFLGSLFITSLQLKENRPVMIGILASFCIGATSDTLFCYSTVGYLLIVMSALCFGELIEKHGSLA